MRGVLFASTVVAVVALTGCGDKPAATTAPANENAKNTDKSGDKPTPKGDKNKTKPDPKAKPSDPAKNPPKTHPAFAAAWESALADSQKLDDTEPAETEAALKKLGAAQRNEAEQCMAQADALEAFGTRLMQLGQVAWLTRQSRKAAIADPEFKEFAEAVWSSKHPPGGGVLGLMNIWKLMSPGDQTVVVRAAKSRDKADAFPPEQRATVTKYLGRDWFKD